MAEPIATTVQRVYAREPDSFRALYECHHARIYALAWRMCGNAQHAEDLTQEVFVRLWDAITSFRGESAFSTWLHRLAVNVIWSALSREHRSDGWLEAATPDQHSRAAAPDDGIASQIDLERAIAALPHGARTMLVLYSIEGYSYREISDALGVDIGTVKSQLHRARRLLLPILSL